MDKIIDIFRNKWVKFGVSFLSLGLPAFMVYVDWLALAYYLQPVSAVPLFLMYILVLFVFAGIMFYTRMQIITRIVALVTPALAFVLLFIAFGNWYLIIPPIVISAFTFLASGMNETLKTILGTVYLLMFVVGTLVYLTMLHFNLTIQTLMPFSECDISKRSTDYDFSPDKTYRLVLYIDNAGNERSLVSYYLEKTADDVELPYLRCYKHLDSLKILATMDKDSVVYKWLSDNELYIDGHVKNIKELFEQAEYNRKNPQSEDPETDKLTYYEEHDWNGEEYYGTSAAELPEPESVPVENVTE